MRGFATGATKCFPWNFEVHSLTAIDYLSPFEIMSLSLSMMIWNWKVLNLGFELLSGTDFSPYCPLNSIEGSTGMY